jgi:hypothetical protein
MKTIKLSVLVMAAALMAFGLSTSALAFHAGGVAHCDGCHTMHNSVDGVVDPTTGGDLTKGSDPTSTCLNCHNGSGSYHVNSADGSNYSAGGDFYWMTKTFTWSAHGRPQSSEADNHGHNVVSLDYGLTADTTLTQAPGGTYNSLTLGCTSCHDPHGKKNGAGAIEESGSYGADPTLVETGNYRLLGDDGYDAGSSVTFTSEVPIATTNNNSESDTNHADYGRNMSEWCANCHGAFSGANKHPTGNDAELSNDDIWINYNTYVRTGDMTGSQATAYLALVPFERGTADPTALNPATTAGPADGTSNVMCLSCHRAHATAFDNATRWDMTTEFIAESHPQASDGGVVGDDVLNSYYGRDLVAQFGEFQRSLCNKCHAQD